MRIFIAALLAVSTFGLAACDTAGSNGTGTISVLLTDAPGDFQRAVVTIDRIYLQSAQGDADPASSRVMLREEPVTVDLLTLQNEVLELVREVAVPEGHYNQLRLVISGGFIEVEEEDGSLSVFASSPAYAASQGVVSTGSLQMPSFAQSGLKITLPQEASQIRGPQNVVLLDFNVAQSFGRQAGASGMWVMHPVVHATTLEFTGTTEVGLSLAEGVSLPEGITLGAFAAQIDKDGDVIEVPFTVSGEQATAQIRYLFPGEYPLTLLPPDGLTITTDVSLPVLVLVGSGEVTQQNIVVTSVVVD